MDTLTVEAVKALSSGYEPPCVTIYMPTEHRTTASGGNGIRFKNLLRQAETQLAEQGLKQRAIEALLEPAWHLHEDRNFWEYQSDGFAFFLGKDLFQYFRLPLPLKEFVTVNRRFHLKPLLELLSLDGHFFVLAVSQNHCRFLYCSRYGVQRLQVPNLPESLAHTLRFDDAGKADDFEEMESAPLRGIGGARTEVMFSGRGGETDRTLKDLTRYFHEIDHALQPVLRAEQAPLILACVEYEAGLYRDVSHYAHVASEVIAGNPELVRDEELREKGWHLAEPIFLHSRHEALTGLQQAMAYRQASTDLEDTVRAACDGAIANLFVLVGKTIWGRFDSDSREVAVHDERQPGDEDLLDVAALEVLTNGGVVWTLQPEEFPTLSGLAATLRYPLPQPV